MSSKANHKEVVRGVVEAMGCLDNLADVADGITFTVTEGGNSFVVSVKRAV